MNVKTKAASFMRNLMIKEIARRVEMHLIQSMVRPANIIAVVIIILSINGEYVNYALFTLIQIQNKKRGNVVNLRYVT